MFNNRGTLACPECGSPVEAAAKFCAACGQSVSQRAAGSEPDRDKVPPTDVKIDAQVKKPIARSFATPKRRWIVAVAAGTAVIVTASLAGFVAYDYSRDQAAHDALTVGNSAFGDLLESFADAEDLADLNDAGRVAAKDRGRFTAAASDASSTPGDLGVRAVGVLQAQEDVVAALSTLASLSADTLGTWQSTSTALKNSSADLVDATGALSDVDPETAADVPDAENALATVSDTVGVFAAGTLTDVGVDLLGQLGAAVYTNDVQRVAAEAARYNIVVASALEGIPTGTPDADRITNIGLVLTQVSAMAAIDADNLDAWQPIRVTLQTQVATVPELTDSGTQAIGNLNELVTTGAQKLTDWKVEYADASKDRKAARAQLDTYELSVRAQLRIYDAARNDSSAYFTKMTSGAPIRNYDFFQDATMQRQYVRDALLYQDVPASVRGAHQRIVDLLTESVRVMGIAEANGFDWMLWCEGSITIPTDCDFRDSTTWQEFSAGSSGISEQFSSAKAQWGRAVDAERGALDRRELPARPAV